MSAMRIVAVETAVADAVRRDGKDARFGFPVFTGNAGEGLPCRHCLQWIGVGERATLFTGGSVCGAGGIAAAGAGVRACGWV